jgi:hypothetical protein
MRCALCLVVLVGCGEVHGKMIDAPPGIDAPMIDSPTDGTTPVLDCAHYCATIMGACTNAVAQFSTLDQCTASCATWTPGALGQNSGNTLGCRLTHAMLAMTDPTVHCVHAGPSGGGVCGQPCEGFCTLDLGVCLGGNAVYADATACASSCAGFNPSPAYSANVTGGNSLSCRIYHATAASVAPNVHCPHTGVTSVTCQ